MLPFWSSSRKDKFSIFKTFSKEYVVCQSQKTQPAIRYVMDMDTCLRKFPTEKQKQKAVSEKELIEILVETFD